MRGREVFSRIAHRYDTLNTILSLGRDGAWRRRAIAYLPEGRVLDLGAGTGAANPEFGAREVVALD
ncbi:MAG TPA: class I SAM-dependent methyltransferase, partial [Acidimicrobiia bacterium]|nr:class I SAM-dependent methyltransferase [Acidimicrobiia bacterium]